MFIAHWIQVRQLVRMKWGLPATALINELNTLPIPIAAPGNATMAHPAPFNFTTTDESVPISKKMHFQTINPKTITKAYYHCKIGW